MSRCIFILPWILLAGFNVRTSLAEEPLAYAAIEYRGIAPATFDKAKPPAQLAFFRVKNTTNEPLKWATHGGAPYMLVRGMVDGQEKLVYWNWCGMGRDEEKLAAGESFYFYIDPEYFRQEHGAKISLGLAIGPEKGLPRQKEFLKNFHWTEWIELPELKQQTQVQTRGMARAPRDEQQKSQAAPASSAQQP